MKKEKSVTELFEIKECKELCDELFAENEKRCAKLIFKTARAREKVWWKLEKKYNHKIFEAYRKYKELHPEEFKYEEEVFVKARVNRFDCFSVRGMLTEMVVECEKKAEKLDENHEDLKNQLLNRARMLREKEKELNEGVFVSPPKIRDVPELKELHKEWFEKICELYPEEYDEGGFDVTEKLKELEDEYVQKLFETWSTLKEEKYTTEKDQFADTHFIRKDKA